MFAEQSRRFFNDDVILTTEQSPRELKKCQLFSNFFVPLKRKKNTLRHWLKSNTTARRKDILLKWKLRIANTFNTIVCLCFFRRHPSAQNRLNYRTNSVYGWLHEVNIKRSLSRLLWEMTFLNYLTVLIFYTSFTASKRVFLVNLFYEGFLDQAF